MQAVIGSARVFSMPISAGRRRLTGTPCVPQGLTRATSAIAPAGSGRRLWPSKRCASARPRRSPVHRNARALAELASRLSGTSHGSSKEGRCRQSIGDPGPAT
jgi:hypothetical protein